MSVSSVGLTLLLSLIAGAVLWLVIEAVTLQDKIPENHITAVVRRVYLKEPGPFVLFAFSLGFLFGHLFW